MIKSLALSILLLSPLFAPAQTLGFFGGAGISADLFSYDKQSVRANSSFATGPLAIAGLRYHTRQNFDILLDASLGIAKIRLPLPEGFEGNLRYEQIQSIITVGSGLNIAFEKSNLMPYVTLGASFLDFWRLSAQGDGKNISTRNSGDFNSNRWSLMCGAGVDYQFKLFLASGLNLRAIYTPINIFPETQNIPLVSKNYNTGSVALQGKFLQFQLTYRVNLPIAHWKEDYD